MAKKKAKKKTAKKAAKKAVKKSAKKTARKPAKKAAKKKAAKRKKPATIGDKISGAYHAVVDTITGTDALRNKMSKSGSSETE